MKEEKGKGIYNVIAIGAGTAGLVTTAAIAGLGGRAALIERNKMGGDCLNFGCVPSKGLIASAKLLQNMRDAEKWGIDRQDPSFDFGRVFASMRNQRAVIEPNDSKDRFEGLGVDVFEAAARFISPYEIELSTGEVLRAKHFVISAGSRAAVPAIPGIEDIPYFTNETIFDHLNDKPKSMIVIGGGPIGTELSQVFNRLGVEVHQVQRGPQILEREDQDVIELLQEVLEQEGVHLHCNTISQKIYQTGGRIHLEIEEDGEPHTIVGDTLLLAAGRVPNLKSLNLEAAGVKTNQRGIIVNKKLQSSQPHIWAAGDIAGGLQFTHVADFMARTVVGNITKPFSFLHSEFDDSVVPWSTYTAPEVARVGHNEKTARKAGVEYDLFQSEFADLDRAITDRKTDGFIKVLTAKGTDKIIGVTIVGENGGDILHEFVLAMKHGIGLSKVAATIHAYPTYAEVARKIGDTYNRTRLTPRAKNILTWLFKQRRSK